MTELVERVARALCERQIRIVRKWDTEPAELEERLPRAVDYAWPDFREQVVTALVAMREPTPEMAAAGFIADDCTAPMDVWRAMIDTAIARARGEKGQ